jgi:hypothetical protein
MVEVIEPDRRAGRQGGWSCSYNLDLGDWSTPEVSAKNSRNGRRFFHKGDSHVIAFESTFGRQRTNYSRIRAAFCCGMQCVPYGRDPMPMSKNKQIGGSLVRALSVLCVALGAASVAAGDTAGEGPQQGSPQGPADSSHPRGDRGDR